MPEQSTANEVERPDNPLLEPATYWREQFNPSLVERYPVNDVDGTRGRTPLHAAVMAASLSGIRALLAAGADPHLANGESPLHIALIIGDRRTAVTESAAIAALLLEHMSPNVQDRLGWTPLHCLANQVPFSADAERAAQVLLHAGADTDVQTVLEQTPLDLAGNRGNTRCAALIEAWRKRSRAGVSHAGQFTGAAPTL